MPVATLILGIFLACTKPCQEKVGCQIEVTGCLLKEGRTREAIERLKPLAGKHPVFARLLARAYLADNNPAWAKKTLQEAVARDPGDCQSRSWLAWVHISQGFLDLAEETLEPPGCPASEADKTRWLLLQSYLARMKDDPAAADKLFHRAADSGQMYREDRKLLRILRGQVDPGWIDPLELRAELSLGYTSNAQADSRIDPYSPPEPPGSPLARADLHGRLVWPTRSNVRPAFDATVRGQGMIARGAKELSYLEISGRPGVLIGRDFPRLLLGYRHDGLFLNQGVQPYYKGHRLEAELETRHVTGFAGAGRRLFNESARSRLELDGGAGFHFLAGKRVRFLLVGSLRYHRADQSHYDQLGGSGLAVARIDMGSGYTARLGAAGGIDYYLNSKGEFGIKDNRIDLTATLSAGMWGPSYRGVRVGFVYDLSWRDSSADIFERDYDYIEHRVLFKTAIALDLNPGAPVAVAGENHVALSYGIDEDSAGLFEERIQDLVRQDEIFRRGSCGCSQ